jgi:hypothetical protein
MEVIDMRDVLQIEDMLEDRSYIRAERFRHRTAQALLGAGKMDETVALNRRFWAHCQRGEFNTARELARHWEI